MFSAALLAVGSFTVLRRALPGGCLGLSWAITGLPSFSPFKSLELGLIQRCSCPQRWIPKGDFHLMDLRKKNCAFSQQLPGPTPQTPAAGPLHSLTRGVSFVCRWWESLGGLGRTFPTPAPQGRIVLFCFYLDLYGWLFSSFQRTWQGKLLAAHVSGFEQNCGK